MIPLSEAPQVAYVGTVDRQDRCPTCQEDMMYRVTPKGKVVEMFCCTWGCSEWLRMKGVL